MSALETGRGLVLHAATVGVGIGALLEDAGRPDLAAEWDAAVPAGWRDGWWGQGADDRPTPLPLDGLMAADYLDVPRAP